MDINQKLLAAFQAEHVEHLEAIRSYLARWSESDIADVDEAFRRAHSLKGAARVTGLCPVEALAHQLESLFSRLRDKTLQTDREVLQTIDAALDAIEDTAARLLQGCDPPDVSQTLEKLGRLLGDHAANDLPARFKADSSCDEHAASRPAPETSSSIQAPRPPDAPSKTAVNPVGTQTVDTVRLSTESLDRLLQSSGQLLSESMQQDGLARELKTISQRLATIEREWESLKLTTAGPLRRLGAAPELAGLSKYVDLVEHEVSGLSRDLRAARLLQQRAAWSVRLLAEQLQDDVRHARLVPAGSEFQSFRKMMRELARDQKKEIEFRVAGFDVLADRMVLQVLKDPLMHVLRNAVSHGIESPSERSRGGKSTTGLITLTIEATGNRLTIEVEDDGCGLDLRRVSEVAVQKGIWSQAEAAAQSPAELARLLFQPGFSTSSAVTDLSGRGMGLSAVHEAATRLRGQVEIRPRAEAGASILFTVPLSISAHRLLLVACRGQTVALPFYGIEALHYVAPQDVASVEGIPMVTLSETLMPLTSLGNILDEAHGQAGIEADPIPIVEMRCGSRRIAVAVEAFVAERHALIKNLGPPADNQSAFMGGILLEDGSVSVVLNPSEVVERYAPSKKPAVCPATRALDAQHRSTILVVDDSFTTRTLETSILETNGYQVRVAVDGVDALEQLRSEKIDLVISDIQMPRLDGLGLLEEIKRDQKLAATPVIIVSSVDGVGDQERGLSLGADAYIVKRRFDHQELLRIVEQIL